MGGIILRKVVIKKICCRELFVIRQGVEKHGIGLFWSVYIRTSCAKIIPGVNYRLDIDLEPSAVLSQFVEVERSRLQLTFGSRNMNCVRLVWDFLSDRRSSTFLLSNRK